MNSKRAALVAAIMTLVASAIAIAYVPVIKLISQTVTTERPLFSNVHYSNEGFRHWEIPHLEQDKHGWEFIVDGSRNVVVLFEPAKRDDLGYTYSIQPPRAGETTLRVWLNKELSHEIVVHDDMLYVIRGALLENVAAPHDLGNSLLSAKSDANNLDFTVGAFLASRDEWSSVAALVNAEQARRENETIPN